MLYLINITFNTIVKSILLYTRLHIRYVALHMFIYTLHV